MRLRGVVLALVLALAGPSAAAAQGTTTANPFAPGLPSAPATTPTASTPTVLTATTASTSGGSLGGGGVVAIAIGALVLLGGISFFIWHDARRRAPVRHGMAHAGGGEFGHSGSKARAKPRKLSPAERRRRKRGRAR
ncbi:MAG TPA: hypothetical protein VMD09_02935 [Solirubrobacteraceae bacterium]|nr:hypothetical protein [Solirubrobacteraceae bacterium]